MFYHRKSLNKMSDRGRLRKEIGQLHLQYLLKQRGYKDEFTGEEGTENDFARFHILTVAAHPRLEFVDENVLCYLRKNWFTWHEPYHHDRDSKLGKKIMARIIDLRGERYLEDLYGIERYMGKHDRLYLLSLKQQFKNELEMK